MRNSPELSRDFFQELILKGNELTEVIRIKTPDNYFGVHMSWHSDSSGIFDIPKRRSITCYAQYQDKLFFEVLRNVLYERKEILRLISEKRENEREIKYRSLMGRIEERCKTREIPWKYNGP